MCVCVFCDFLGMEFCCFVCFFSILNFSVNCPRSEDFLNSSDKQSLEFTEWSLNSCPGCKLNLVLGLFLFLGEQTK